MLASKHRVARLSFTQDTYVCLSCRLKVQQRQLHNDSTTLPLAGAMSHMPEKRKRLTMRTTVRTKSPPLDDEWALLPIRKILNQSPIRKHSHHGPSQFEWQTRPYEKKFKPHMPRIRRYLVGGNKSIAKYWASKGGDPFQMEVFDYWRGKATFNTRRVLTDDSMVRLERATVLHLDQERGSSYRRDQNEGGTHTSTLQEPDQLGVTKAWSGSSGSSEHPYISNDTHSSKPGLHIFEDKRTAKLEISTEEASFSRETAVEQSAVSSSAPPYYAVEEQFSRTATSHSLTGPAVYTRRVALQSTFRSPTHKTLQIRTYHASRMIRQAAATAVANRETSELSQDFLSGLSQNRQGIRAQLHRWQEIHGHEDTTSDPVLDSLIQDDFADPDAPVNNLTNIPDLHSVGRGFRQDEEDEEAFAHFAEIGASNLDGSAQAKKRFLNMGDLVEISFPASERESVLAVYVQDVLSVANVSQFFTMQGRWVHVPKVAIQYSIPDWISPRLVEPLLAHLPTPDDARDVNELMERAYMQDLSVPRKVAAPLVKRLLEFYNESQEIYRRHASALDNAHQMLAHDTDLRYGSLTSAASTLLGIPREKLPLTALFAVRKALSNGGFAFNIDRRSHRITGYIQIRSRNQVRMVEEVRNWLRHWQEDMAFMAGKNEHQRLKHKPARGAQIVYNFLEKAKAIVARSRENRQPTDSNNIGPSKIRFPISEDSEAIKVELGNQFNQDEQEIIRFMEAWCCSNMFDSLPRLQSLPPLLIQATGLYDKSVIDIRTGFMFMQELGTITPYENRIRFDQHLLLPSSQHSKPLQLLMSNLLAMKNSHNFQDSMAALRHDWQGLPVYCIDDSDAHEIDDGISIEDAGTDANGQKHQWLHMHIANPTAFFSRDHPLAKMARHMGETIYMPERTYMMLPRWATQRHFSLGPDRPCLTFSAKLDEQGNTMEHKITPGIIRNVIQLTPRELRDILGPGRVDESQELVLRVGGDMPNIEKHPERVQHMAQSTSDDLVNIAMLASKRAEIRKKAGGVFFNSESPDVTVRQNARSVGLAWDHPYRKGSRIIHGDPLIEVRTRGLRNWFAPSDSLHDALVRECMLLACEIAASWCSERQIPVIYRGTIHDPSKPDPKNFLQEVVVPAAKPDGSYPMHIGLAYIQTVGTTVLRTTPVRHDMLGMDYYAKVTSPLRRYGDMILHWQIEAALRHEAESGRSLAVATRQNVDRSFLPFSVPTLDAIMLGLQPREGMITRAKKYASNFWQAMLMFRKYHFGEDGELPFKRFETLSGNTSGSRTLRGYVYVAPEKSVGMRGIAMLIIELNMQGTMMNPTLSNLPEAKTGDVWEVEIKEVDVYNRTTLLKPIKLIGREGAGIL